MTGRAVAIIDQGRDVVATANVELLDGRYAGRVDVGPMPPPLLVVFEEFEEIVNDQVFGLLDRIEGRIDALSLSASFGDGHEVPVDDLQIFPKGGTVSFRIAEPAEARRDRSNRLDHTSPEDHRP